MWILTGLCLILLGICAYTDIKSREVIVSLPLLFLFLTFLFRGMQGVFWQGAAELLLRFVPGIILLSIHMIKSTWIGTGDVLLVLCCGYMIGAKGIFQMVMIASFFSGIAGAALLIFKKYRRNDTLPFVPFLLAGCVGVCVLQAVEGTLL